MSALDHPVALAAFIFVLGVGSWCAPSPSNADAWTDHEVALGRLCWNESGSRADCIAIVEARGRYSVEALRRMHPRALGDERSDARRWIAGLDASMQRPAHWPEELVPWETRGLARWTKILETVRATLRGELSVCSERPHVWGSRTLDADRLARIHARGGREVCQGTQNAFVRFGAR